jgi:hypothetical protein
MVIIYARAPVQTVVPCTYLSRMARLRPYPDDLQQLISFLCCHVVAAVLTVHTVYLFDIPTICDSSFSFYAGLYLRTCCAAVLTVRIKIGRYPETFPGSRLFLGSDIPCPFRVYPVATEEGGRDWLSVI